MNPLLNFENFINEKYANIGVGNIVEFPIPGRAITHTGKVISKTAAYLIVIDDKTGEEVKVPLSNVGATYEERLAEAKVDSTNFDDLYKIYVTIDGPDQKWWNHKDLVNNSIYQWITPDNYKTIDIDKTLPVLTYNKTLSKNLLDEGRIKKENLYNLPEFYPIVGSKEEFHKRVNDNDNIPKTVSTQKAALTIGFPLIAKPSEGHSGLGIQVFKDQDSFDKADHSKFNVYSEYIDKNSEHRVMLFKGTPFFWMERNPVNDKAKLGSGSTEDRMMFKYIKRDVNKLPKNFSDIVSKFAKIFSELPFVCFDVMEDKNGKIYVIEGNSHPGMPFNAPNELYKLIFKDFYKKNLSKESIVKIDKLSKRMDEVTTSDKSKNFEIKL
jgi:hypothetical protein